jgi:hypothetical protein
MSLRIQAVNYGTYTELHSIHKAVDLMNTVHYEFAFFEECHAALVFCLESVMMRLLDDISERDRNDLYREQRRLVSLIEVEKRTHNLGL